MIQTYEIWRYGDKRISFIVEETKFRNSKRRNKTYIIKKDGKTILITTLHQIFYKYLKQYKKVGTILVNE